MSEQLRESLSALMDGEADSQDVDRVLDNIHDASVRDTWQRYNLAQDVAAAASVANVTGIDLSAGIMAALDAEPAHNLSQDAVTADAAVSESVPEIHSVGRWQRFTRPLASIAVAASVTAVVVFGSQYAGLTPGGNALTESTVASIDALAGAGQPGGDGLAENLEIVESVESNAPVTLLGGTATLAGYATPSSARSTRVAPAAPDADYNVLAHERLRRYILSHAEEASLNAPQGMMPYARVATFRSED